MLKLSSIKNQPLYDQLVDVLKDKIETELTPGDVLPSERDLSCHYGLSRTTVRLALSRLEELGLIFKKQGKGSIVSDYKNNVTDLSLSYSFTDHMLQIGRIPHTYLLSFDIVRVHKTLAAKVQIDVGDQLYSIKRLRTANKVPMMVEISYLPVSLFPKLHRDLIQSKPLYTIFAEDFDYSIKLAKETFSASIIRYDDAQLLEVHEGAPGLFIERETYNEDNMVIEYTQSIARADQFKYTITHTRN